MATLASGASHRLMRTGNRFQLSGCVTDTVRLNPAAEAPSIERTAYSTAACCVTAVHVVGSTGCTTSASPSTLTISASGLGSRAVDEVLMITVHW